MPKNVGNYRTIVHAGKKTTEDFDGEKLDLEIHLFSSRFEVISKGEKSGEKKVVIKTKKKIMNVCPSMEGEVVICFFADETWSIYDAQTGEALTEISQKVKRANVYQ